MKRITLLLSVFLVISAFLHANPVDLKTAKTIGAKFLKASTEMKNIEVNDLEFVTAYNMNDGTAAFYVFNAESGFVIVAANDCATPILGYSVEGQFVTDEIPIQLRGYLKEFVEQIEYGIANETFNDEKTMRQWELVKTSGRISESKDAKAVGPLLASQWGQGNPYNLQCPVDANNKRAITGCVATAMGQIMRYYGYPQQGNGSHSYTPAGYSTQSVNFGETTYDWGNMPDKLLSSSTQEQKDAVSTLLYHCGVAVDMMYGPAGGGGSGAYSTDVPYAMLTYFKYSDEMSYDYRQYNSDEVWLNRVKACLDLERPVYYTGQDEDGGGGHAFVCDGYDADDYLHFNWGWNGSDDGYFPVNALNVSGYKFNMANFGIFNLHPQGSTTSHTITVTTENADYGSVSGSNTYLNGATVTVTATANSGYTFLYWTENGIIVSAEADYEFKAEYSRDLVARFAESSTLCEIVYDFQDNFGDGWQTNMLVVTYSNNFKEYMTLMDGHNGLFPRKVTKESTINLKWVKGYYIEENQFFIKWPNGRIIYENTSPSSSLDTDVEINTATPGIVDYYFTGASSTLWSNSGNWISGVKPTSTSDVSVKTNVILDENATIASLSVDCYDTIFINSGITLTVTGAITQASRAMIVVEDGGQLVQNNSDIRAIVKKNVTQWATTPSVVGWHGIASPIDGVVFDSILNLATDPYNVYRYNEVTATWENCLNSGNLFTSLENGRGYLYRKSDAKALRFKGKLNASDVEYQLSYTTAVNDLAGFHLIGNPFSHNIYKGAGTAIESNYLETGFYTLKTDGTWEACADNATAIAPCQAILVEAVNTVTNEKINITNTTAKNAGKDGYDYISLSVSNASYNDVAYALFNEGGHGLNKIEHRNEAVQQVFINHNGENFAVAEMSSDTKSFDVYFKAKTAGNYTLKIDYQGDFSYLHLIDRLTGDDVDMLLDGEYTFIASPSDSEARFIVTFGPSTGSGADDCFAFQNGNEIVVRGEGTLQVFDATGRLIKTMETRDNETIISSSLPTGVYIFRLTGDTVRTQKMVIR